MTQVLGIEFFQGTPQEAAARALAGGLTVAPSGPNLADLDRMPAYQQALQCADLVVLDSGFLVLCWRRQSGQQLTRLSGLLLLQHILQAAAFHNEPAQLWVMPSEDAAMKTRAYLAQRGVALPAECFYVAPFYATGEITDPELLALIQRRAPQFVVINVAGGKQEVLGAWLKSQLPGKPAIICTGAAIAFLTGEQASIPAWGDRLFLGWLLRILQNPRRYLGRYWRARRLKYLVETYGASAPLPDRPCRS